MLNTPLPPARSLPSICKQHPSTPPSQFVDAGNLSAVTDVSKQATLLAIAAHFPAKDRGTVRLIDNCVLNEHV